MKVKKEQKVKSNKIAQNIVRPIENPLNLILFYRSVGKYNEIHKCPQIARKMWEINAFISFGDFEPFATECDIAWCHVSFVITFSFISKY